MVLLESTDVPLQSKAPSFDLPGIDGKQYTLDDFNDKKAIVIIFMCNHCPYVQGVIQRLIALQEKYKKDNVQFIGINANESENYPEDSMEKMKQYAKKWGLNFPYLRDKTQKVAKEYDAQCTPDIFVYNTENKLVYHGRIDDNWQEEENVTSHDLDNALNALINNKTPKEKQYPSMGCSIKWLDS
ncbi:redoxin domain-containing protein [Candidatus Peregrinibacteria bacterium]|nr:redoxin domain-containing protein [Candidatus Peregrinibacteria bacterium]